MNISTPIKQFLKFKPLIFFLFIFNFGCSSQVKSNKEDSYLSKIVNGLISTVQIENNPVYYQLEDRMKHHGATGFSLATINNFKIENSKGFGYCQKENGIKVGANSIFRVGSISKSLTAIIILKLQDNGKLDLDTDIKNYLKTWSLPDSKFINNKPVTLRTLLKHTSGLKRQQLMKLADHGFVEGDKTFTLNEVLDGKSPLQAITFTTEPGESFKYSNQGYNLIQKVIEDVTNESFEKTAQELVLNPFNMTNSTFKTVYPHITNNNFCYAYKGEIVHQSLFKNTTNKSSGGLFSTAQDLAKFSIKVANIVNGIDPYLSQDSAKEILSEDKYGLGFDHIIKENLSLISHSGRVPGFYSFMAIEHQEGNGFVMLVNSDGVDDLFMEMLRSVSNAFNYSIWKPKTITRIEIDINDYQNHVGSYSEKDEEDSVIKVIIKNNQLFYQEFGDEMVYEYPLIPISKNIFIDGIDGNKIEFTTEGDAVIGATYDDEYNYIKLQNAN